MDTVKALTISTSGDKQDQPLHVSTKDNRDFSAFAVAVIHGDHRMIKLILEIAGLQYAPPTSIDWANYPNRGDDDDSDSGRSESYDSDGYAPSDSEEGKDKDKDRTTVDVREVSNVFPSSDHPLDILLWTAQFWRFCDSWEKHARARMADWKARFINVGSQVCISLP